MKLRMWFKTIALVLVLGLSTHSQQIITEEQVEKARVLNITNFSMIGYHLLEQRQYYHHRVLHEVSQSNRNNYKKILNGIIFKGIKISPQQMVWIDKITCGTFNIGLLRHVDWSIGNKNKSDAIKVYFKHDLKCLDLIDNSDKTDDTVYEILGTYDEIKLLEWSDKELRDLNLSITEMAFVREDHKIRQGMPTDFRVLMKQLKRNN